MRTDINADVKQENFRCHYSLLSHTISTLHAFSLSLGTRTCTHTHTHTYTHTHTHTVLFCLEAHALTRVRPYKGESNEDIEIFYTKFRAADFSTTFSLFSRIPDLPHSNIHISKQCWWLVLLAVAHSRILTFLALLKIFIWLYLTQQSQWVPHPFTSSMYNI
jgi:hypothetical protein